MKSYAANIAGQLRALGPRGAPILPVNRWVHMAIGDENIEPAIVVIVEQCNAGTRSFEDGGLICCARVMKKLVEPRLCGNAEENDRSPVNKPTSSYGPGVCVPNGAMRRAIDTPMPEEGGGVGSGGCRPATGMKAALTATASTTRRKNGAVVCHCKVTRNVVTSLN